MIRAILRNGGIQPRRLVSAWRGWQRYVRNRAAFRQLLADPQWPWARELPMLTEWSDTAGSTGAYFFQDQRVARWIFRAAPRRHVDVGSRLDGFIGSVSVFREVEVIDIRPGPPPVPNVRYHQLDLMKDLPADWVGSTDSLSCLHTIEHFGLGRYGDPIDPDGHLKGLAQLKRMVAPGGLLYLSTPIGPQRIEFDAHRVFAAQTLIDWFADGWTIEQLVVIDDQNQVLEPLDWRASEVAKHFGCHLGVGIVVARKNA
jgi:SAM-dependent methyltransferase